MTQVLLITLAAALAAAPSPAEPTAEEPVDDRAVHALGPGAEAALRRLLDLPTPLSNGLHLNASVAGTEVRVTAGKPPAIAVTLRHPSDVPVATPDVHRIRDVALVPAPGPAPPALRAEITARLDAAGSVELPWIAPSPAAPDKPATRKDTGAHSVDSLRQQLVIARYAIDTGEPDRARQLLAALPSPLTAPAAVEVAILHKLAGDPKSALALLDRHPTLPAPLDATAALIRGSALPDLHPDRTCDYAQVADHAQVLGLEDRAVGLAAEVRKKAPTCIEAWEAHLQLLVHANRADEAVALVDAAIETYPDEDRVLSAAAAAYQASGQLAKAVPLLERVTRRHLEERNSLRVLLGAMIRDVPNRQLYRDALAEQIAKDPDDVLSRFLAGVLHHYASEFEASNALLRPLEKRLDHEDRIHIYLAMNDFNLGDTRAALDRLDQAALRPDPDPDVFYCRAEILRDTNRKQAREDLGKYASFSSHNILSNPAKEARIQRLLDLLDACILDGRAECEGEWEHPRLRFADQREDETRRAIIAGAAALALLLGIGLVVWRRRRAAGA